MTSGFPGSPRLLKGALVVYESHTPGAASRVIAFQYNPHQVSRSLSQGTTGTTEGGGRAGNPSRGQAQQDVLRVEGPPRETIRLTVELDAADALEHPQEHGDVVSDGLHTMLATLELLLYPTSVEVLRQQTLAEQGEVQLNPAELPLTLLVWGRSRVAPVLLTALSVTEDAFDPALNPVKATVELELRVLSYVDLPADSAGRDVYLAYQRRKESLAGRYRAGQREGETRGLLPG